MNTSFSMFSLFLLDRTILRFDLSPSTSDFFVLCASWWTKQMHFFRASLHLPLREWNCWFTRQNMELQTPLEYAIMSLSWAQVLFWQARSEWRSGGDLGLIVKCTMYNCTYCVRGGIWNEIGGFTFVDLLWADSSILEMPSNNKGGEWLGQKGHS